MLTFIRRHSFILSILLCAVWIGAFAVFSDRLGKNRLEEQEKALNTSISRCIVSCYALEGFYPPDLDYMKQHYGLNYDEASFFVDYRPVASNIRPDYFIIRTAEE